MENFDFTTLIQLPFIAAFIWFAVKMSNDYRSDAKQRDAHWMEFLTLEREQRRQAMVQGMDEVKEITSGMVQLTEAMGELARAIAEHNIGAEVRFKDLKETIREK